MSGFSIVGGECRIRSKSPWITVVDSISALNNVAWGDRAWSVDEFEIFIAPFVLDTYGLIHKTINMRWIPYGMQIS